MNKGLGILCVLHKEVTIPSLPFILPVQVGAALSSWQSPYVKDNSGDHISEKNTSFNEITALYWAWKNNFFNEYAYAGLCHYRRLFLSHKKWWSQKAVYNFPAVTGNLTRQMKDLPVIVPPLLEKYDLIVSKPSSTRDEKKRIITIAEQYALRHHAEDWNILHECIAAVQPGYLSSFETFQLLTKFSQMNMFIGKKKFLDQYMPWLMSIMFELEKRLPVRQDSYQRRAIGFISERLMGLYIHHHRLKTTWLPLAFIEG